MSIFTKKVIVKDYSGEKEVIVPNYAGIIVSIVLFLIGWVVVSMAVMPSYRIYKQNKQGQANLRQ